MWRMPRGLDRRGRDERGLSVRPASWDGSAGDRRGFAERTPQADLTISEVKEPPSYNTERACSAARGTP